YARPGQIAPTIPSGIANPDCSRCSRWNEKAAPTPRAVAIGTARRCNGAFMSAKHGQPEPGESESKPGKTRTWWHPLLASFLRWQLSGYYQLFEEVPVGQKPLQIDILLLHKEKGELPERARRILAGLVERLAEYTLIELK